jgi:hypothetical protein
LAKSRQSNLPILTFQSEINNLKSDWQFHFLQEGFLARVALQAAQQRITLYRVHAASRCL